VPNGFARTLDVMAEAARRYRDVPRLRRNVLTVITRENHAEIVRLAEFLRDHAEIDGQYFEVVRGAAPDPSLKVLTRETVAGLHAQLMPFHRHYADRLFAGLAPGVRNVAKLYYLGNLRFHFDLHESCLEGPDPWPMPCTAGETSIVIDHNGRFRACEMRGAVGDLHEYNFDIQRALASEAMRAEVGAIPGANCWCTHSCFIQESSKFSSKAQLVKIPIAALARPRVV
jgi:MoaA/NifB/PqqE/SkfB family radical SAM enzyme